jgi:hypothetical protein
VSGLEGRRLLGYGSRMVVARQSALWLMLSSAQVAAAQDHEAVLVMVEAESLDPAEVRHAVQEQCSAAVLGLGDDRATLVSRQLTISLSDDRRTLTLFYQDTLERRIVRTHRRGAEQLLPWIGGLAAGLLRETTPPRWFVVSEVIDPFGPGGGSERPGEVLDPFATPRSGVIDPFATPRRSAVIDPWRIPPARRRTREGARGLDRPRPSR